MKRLFLLLSCLCWNASFLLAADPAPMNLGGDFAATELGKLPAGWKAIKGDWAVRLDEQPAPEGTEEAAQPMPIVPQREKESLLPRVLSTDLQGGVVQYEAKEFGDFTFTYQMKHFTERDYWVNQFRFRIQGKGKYGYYVKRERYGKMSLYGLDGTGEKLLATSEGKLDLGQGQWVWVRVKAEGNRFQVWACTDGVSFSPFLDYTDEKNLSASGKIAFMGPHRFHFAFLENPWNNNAELKKKPAWLTRMEQGRAFQQNAGTPFTQYQVQVEYFVNDPAKAPSAVAVECGGKKKTVELVKPLPGFNTVHVLADIKSDAERESIRISLLRGSATLGAATCMVMNTFRQEKLAAANPKPETDVDVATPVSKKDYMACLDKVFAKYGNTNRFGWDDRWGENTVMYRATGDKKYLDRVMEWTRLWIKGRTSGKTETPGFHFASRPGFANAATLAIEKGDLTPDEKKIFLSIIADVLATNAQEGGGIMNRSLGYALSIKPLLKLVPDHPMRKELMKYHDAMMTDFMATKEVLENSSNYMPITMLYMISWIDDNGLQELYQDPKLKQTFENVLQLLDPSGGLPQFADYGGKHQYSFKVLAVLERLATVYKDGRFKWAAHQMARRLLQKFDVEQITGGDTEGIACAYAYADDSIPEVRPSNGSAVLERNTGHLDKLVLRSGWGKDDFHVAVDFVAGCEHGDNDSLAVLSVYKDGGQSLFDKAGRDISNHSLPLIREQAEDYPYPRQPWEAGRWYQASFDLKLFSSWGTFSGGAGSPLGHQYLYGEGMIPYDFTYNPAREFAFAWALNGNGKARVYLDDVKLVKSGATPGKNEKETVLEDFEGPAYRWIGNFQKAEGAHGGKGCGRFDVDFAESNFIGKKFQMPLDVYGKDYDRIEFWFKFEPVVGEIGGWATLHVGDKSGTPRNYPMTHNQNHAVKQKFFKEGQRATFAGFALEDRNAFGEPQGREREFLFVKNKVLWVRDRMRTDTARSFAAGPVWQVGSLAGAKGANWYDTWVENNLMVWFVPKRNAVIEALSDPQPKGHEAGWKKQYPAVLSQKVVGKGPSKSMVFDTLLVPHKGNEDAAKLAAQITVLYDQDDVTLLSVDGGLLLCNPSGKTFRSNELETDCRMVFVKVDGSRADAEAEGGTRVVFKGQALDISGK